MHKRRPSADSIIIPTKVKKLQLNLRLHVFATVGVALSISFLTGCRQEVLEYPPAYREYTYVTNGKSNDVTVINNLSFKTIKTIAVGKSPTGVAVNPIRNEVYVVNTDSNSLSVIEAERNTVVATI